MPESKSALIVANWKYEDADLRQLVAPANDAEALAGVLRDPKICGFDVTTLLNCPSHEACEQIERFFLNRKRDDLLLLYFSCHGIKDDDGLLYFAAPDTRLIDHTRPLRSTALSADFVRAVMRASQSRRQVLMLDCCYSGAFAGAMMAKGDKSAGVKDQFEQGRGMVVMTASDALQYSFEGENVAGEAVNSIFTRVLVKGIQTGEADRDRDGTISLDELYDYVYERVVEENANQRPNKWDLGVEGRIIVAQTPVVRAAELASDLVAAISSPLSRIRLGAVGELADLLKGSHKGFALAAREALEKLAGDDSRQVSMAAEAALGRGEPLPGPPANPPLQVPAAPAAPNVHLGSVQPPPKPVAPREQQVRPAAMPAAPIPEPREPEEEAGGKKDGKQPRILGFPVPNLAAIAFMAVVLGGGFAYRLWHHAGQSPQSSGQPKQSEPAKSEASAAVNPMVLLQPPFQYYLAGQPAQDSKVRLAQVSSKPNQITDKEQWFKGNDLELPTLTVPNPFQQEVGNIPPRIPVKQGDDMLVKAIKQGDDLLCMYGRNFAAARYLTSFNLNTGKANFAFDFHLFMHPPKYEEADREYVDEVVNWAQVKDNVLYVSTGHNTYARSSFGLNAYLNAIDVSSGRLLWRSQPLVSNSSNFLLYSDAIITGYGFTAEDHFLYVVNQKDGRVVQKITLRKMAEHILNKGDDIYVRTYDTDYVFKATEQ